ncbi:MAG: hypothetical protein ACYC3Q_08230 [Gemmatimonadaceae bacterium]
MPIDLSALITSVEDEFGVEIENADAAEVTTPRELALYIVENMPEPGEHMDDDERRDYVESVLGELIAQVLGITRYDEESTFGEILQRSRRR